MSLDATPEYRNNSENNVTVRKNPVKNSNEKSDKTDEEHYSIFDKAPRDGVVSASEQKNAFFKWFNETSQELKEVIISYGYELKDILEQCASRFIDITTDGTKSSAKLADLEVERRFNKTGRDILVKLDELKDAEDEKEQQQKLEDSKIYTQQFNDALNNAEEIKENSINNLHGKTKTEQMGIIKSQYSYYTEEEVEARYELQNLPYKSADIFAELHSGENPVKVLTSYKQNLSQHINNTVVEITQDPTCKTTNMYDNNGRIISSEHAYADGGVCTSVYKYNEDGSYINTLTDPFGIITEEYYNSDGRLMFQISRENDMITEFRDCTKEKCVGDID